MQILGLLTLGVPIWQGSRLPSQNWFFIGVTIVATILAVSRYLYVPVAYSSTLMFGAMAAQVCGFATCVGALAGVAMSQGGKEKTQ